MAIAWVLVGIEPRRLERALWNVCAKSSTSARGSACCVTASRGNCSRASVTIGGREKTKDRCRSTGVDFGWNQTLRVCPDLKVSMTDGNSKNKDGPVEVSLDRAVKSAITYFPAEQYHRQDELHFCVRDGNRCGLSDMVTGKNTAGDQTTHCEHMDFNQFEGVLITANE